MNKTVILTAKDGQIFTQAFNANGKAKLDKNGKPTGYIRVENPGTIDLEYAYNGGLRRGQSALIPMSVEGWERSKHAYKEGMEIKGNVVITESVDFANAEEARKEGFKPKMAGSGENAQPCLLDGKQIYRKTEFDATCKLEDTLIPHNNVIEGSNVAAKAGANEALN